MRLSTASQTILARWRAVRRPAMFHGLGRTRDFFEGWYFKFADLSERNVWAVIPGVFLASSKIPGEESHAFVQTLNGRSGESHYHRYPLREFQASADDFDLRIGPNRFRTDSLHLEIERPEQTIMGELAFRGITPGRSRPYPRASWGGLPMFPSWSAITGC
jgi:tocopherol cyclase